MYPSRPGAPARPPALEDCGAVVGLDASAGHSPWGLARLERRPRGWLLASALEARPGGLLRVLPRILRGACLACIDAPITPAMGGPFRPHERAALRLGARLLPLTSPPMRRLTAVGIAVAAALWEAGVWPCETHPGSAARLADIDFPQGLGGHARDALVAAAVGALLVEGQALLVCSRSGCLALPRPGSKLIFPFISNR